MKQFELSLQINDRGQKILARSCTLYYLQYYYCQDFWHKTSYRDRELQTFSDKAILLIPCKCYEQWNFVSFTKRSLLWNWYKFNYGHPWSGSSSELILSKLSFRNVSSCRGRKPSKGKEKTFEKRKITNNKINLQVISGSEIKSRAQ